MSPLPPLRCRRLVGDGGPTHTCVMSEASHISETSEAITSARCPRLDVICGALQSEAPPARCLRSEPACECERSVLAQCASTVSTKGASQTIFPTQIFPLVVDFSKRTPCHLLPLVLAFSSIINNNPSTPFYPLPLVLAFIVIFFVFTCSLCFHGCLCEAFCDA